MGFAIYSSGLNVRGLGYRDQWLNVEGLGIKIQDQA